MKKMVRCRDVGFDCDGVVKGDTNEEVVNLAAQHAMQVHGVKDITPEIADKVRSVIRDVEE